MWQLRVQEHGREVTWQCNAIALAVCHAGQQGQCSSDEGVVEGGRGSKGKETNVRWANAGGEAVEERGSEGRHFHDSALQQEELSRAGEECGGGGQVMRGGRHKRSLANSKQPGEVGLRCNKMMLKMERTGTT